MDAMRTSSQVAPLNKSLALPDLTPLILSIDYDVFRDDFHVPMREDKFQYLKMLGIAQATPRKLINVIPEEEQVDGNFRMRCVVEYGMDISANVSKTMPTCENGFWSCVADIMKVKNHPLIRGFLLFRVGWMFFHARKMTKKDFAALHLALWEISAHGSLSKQFSDEFLRLGLPTDDPNTHFGVQIHGCPPFEDAENCLIFLAGLRRSRKQYKIVQDWPLDDEWHREDVEYIKKCYEQFGIAFNEDQLTRAPSANRAPMIQVPTTVAPLPEDSSDEEDMPVSSALTPKAVPKSKPAEALTASPMTRQSVRFILANRGKAPPSARGGRSGGVRATAVAAMPATTVPTSKTATTEVSSAPSIHGRKTLSVREHKQPKTEINETETLNLPQPLPKKSTISQAPPKKSTVVIPAASTDADKGTNDNESSLSSASRASKMAESKHSRKTNAEKAAIAAASAIAAAAVASAAASAAASSAAAAVAAAAAAKETDESEQSDAETPEPPQTPATRKRTKPNGGRKSDTTATPKTKKQKIAK